MTGPGSRFRVPGAVAPGPDRDREIAPTRALPAAIVLVMAAMLAGCATPSPADLPDKQHKTHPTTIKSEEPKTGRETDCTRRPGTSRTRAHDVPVYKCR